MSGPLSTNTKLSRVIQASRRHLSNRSPREALRTIATLNSRSSNDPEVLYLSAIAHEQLEHSRKAIELAKRALKQVKRVEPMLILARCYRRLGETEQGISWCEQIKKHRPDDLSVIALHAGTLEEAGRVGEAFEILSPVVSHHRSSGAELPLGPLCEWSKVLVQRKDYIGAIACIDKLLSRDDLPDSLRVSSLFLKAKAFDRAGEYAAAWECADIANQLGHVEYDPELHEEGVDALLENWSLERMALFPISNCESQVPVFIAGMPRSGTSLIDQIIDAHPRAAGVGELDTIETFALNLARNYVPNLAPPACFGNLNSASWSRVAHAYIREVQGKAHEHADRIVNKALGNDKLIGVLAKLFPRTKIIHAIRDPRDVAISCFMGGFNNNVHAWTTKVEWVANAWALSERMMRHWKETLDIPILEVRYEQLVADPQNEIPRIVDFLGLEWHDSCFDFHKSSRTVRTLSYDQVNRPIYNSSAGRHVNYIQHIDGVRFPEYY